ncbi:hypothetical protein [Hafnia paralvei]|uniref:hypothetical protein n=1 Tax=Hafnia paralvei TaxID=546367 RepID=UPI001CF4EE0F|nr:hypothetical protein [Hafnia paralvei]
MTKLTTERLEEIAKLEITEFSNGMDIAKDAYQSVGSSEIVLMARQLLAYEQAAEHPAARITWDGSEFSVSNVSEDFLYGGTAVYLAPVLPKQPESESIICWSCKKTITLTQHAEADGFCPLCDAEIELEPTQPVIPEQIEPAAWRCDKEGTKGVVITVHKQVADSWILKGWKVTPLIEANQSQPVSEPYKLEIDLDDADHFSITHLQEIIYGKELIWPEAKLLARFMLDVKQRVSAAPAQESE